MIIRTSIELFSLMFLTKRVLSVKLNVAKGRIYNVHIPIQSFDKSGMHIAGIPSSRAIQANSGVGQEGMVRRTAQCTSHLSKTMPPRYASRPTANICCGMGTALGETSVALYQGSLTVALGRLEINILIKVIIVLPFKNTKFHGLNSIPRCKFYFHTKSLLYLQRVYLD